MSKIIFIADFFSDEIPGGGEFVNKNLINLLTERNFSVETIKSQDVTEKYIKENFENWFIVANFINLKEEVKSRLRAYKYLIYEHDHKYLSTRDPSAYKNYIAPQEHIINRSFYKNARAVLCQSQIHASVLSKNLLIDNVVALPCSLWSKEEIKVIEKNCKNKKNDKVAIQDSSNIIKGTFQAIEYCKVNKIDYDLLPATNFENFISKLSQYKTLVFFPKTLETFCRLIAEARMLNCEIITNNFNGVTHEEWFSKFKGKQLINYVKKAEKDVVDKVVSLLEETDQKPNNTKPLISVITSVYNADEFIESFLDDITSQTIFDQSELILINCNSPGNEEKVIQKYVTKYSNIIYKKLDEDSGVYDAWNKALEVSSGEFITNANTDDRRSIFHLEAHVRSLLQNPDVGLVYSGCFTTKVPNETFQKNSSNGRLYPIYSFSPEMMIKSLPGCMPVWRRSLHEKSGYFNKNFKFAGDWELWLRFVRNGEKFKQINGVYGLYYENPKGLSTDKTRSLQKFKEERQIFFEFSDIFGEEVRKKYINYFSQETVSAVMPQGGGFGFLNREA